MSEHSDLDRLRKEYQKRKNNEANEKRYSLTNKAYAFQIQQRQNSLQKIFRDHQLEQNKLNRILEIGCGSGGVLQEMSSIHYPVHNLSGIDILFDRLQIAKTKLTDANICCSDGQRLPFKSNSFDLVLQFTAFSSILDTQVKHRMAQEILRVLQQNGAILWYDFWLNPTNKQTKGIKPKEIRGLFPDCSFDFQKITLAPPIARRIVPISWSFAAFLESLLILNSHYLVIIQKKS
jgi:ubiquinone/menaquinone biosynthesis C-methylase UbiE